MQFVDYQDLSAADFLMHPVWAECHLTDYGKPWYDEADEGACRPWKESYPSKRSGSFLIRAQVRDARGGEHVGFVHWSGYKSSRSNDDVPALAYLPVLLTRFGWIELWRGAVYQFGTKHVQRDARRLCKVIGVKKVAEAFPLTFTIDHIVRGRRVSFGIDGFYGFVKENVAKRLIPDP